MNALAKKLGLEPTLRFYDVYSLDDEELLALIPRPVYALLVILPLTRAWDEERRREDEGREKEGGVGGPILYFPQTIGHACGSIGLLHCLLNGPAKAHILPNSILARIRETANPLDVNARAQLLYEDREFEDAHQSVAELGDTRAPSAEDGDRLGQHFVAFVKEDGRLWELEGNRKRPLDRGALAEEDDVLSPRALALGLKRVIDLELRSGGGDLRFSCIALAKAEGV
ncbi:hypothetical protein M430DRAFT_30761 [Amorphotheca resinae ATCC 22711]|uniref:Ubiquitin carboxyl-terminal hydrolase n=1 Tax=Amorphotheca resinae ATCC 22711 TaxID=857342 RepID=A0A2T3ATT9_AMORE|nr:hypothetical protein M430DRAFT_30761 [Amorphotheca resinae ATCC 22711]PSS10883.1 hypothetical protein M430DRAFT_30761 [Amorphotheca resinae ATCC 22711]